jgi:hypothetical protein
MCTGSSRGFAFALAGFLGGSTFIYYLINPDRLAGSRVRTLGMLFISTYQLAFVFF